MFTKDIGELEQAFKDAGFSNSESPFYDFSDQRVQEAYEDLKLETKAEVASRDTTSWNEIQNAVWRHIAKHGNGALVIIAGAAPHIWGAVPYMEHQFGTRYIPATCNKLGIDFLAEEEAKTRFEGIPPEERQQAALKTLKVQMKRQLGVVRHLGYDTIEDFAAAREKVTEPKNIALGLEETGLHEYYVNQYVKPLYDILLDYLKKHEPSNILFIGEDLFVDNMQRNFENGVLYHSSDFIFQWAKEHGIPVEFGAFGIEDKRQNGEKLNHPKHELIKPDIALFESFKDKFILDDDAEK